MKNHLLWILPILFGGFLLAGCVKRTPQPLWVSKVSTMKEPIGSEEILRLPEGDQISFVQLLDDLQMARVIFVGESHDRVEHHQIQVKIIQKLLEKGKDLAIAMEMFQKGQQPVLDRWSQGLLSEEEFLKEVQWETTWGIDYHLYKGVLDEIRNNRLKVLCLNVQRDLVRKVAQNGTEGLSPEEKKMLPEMDLTDQQHRAYIRSIYKTHQGGSAKDLENFYQAQCLWDEAMAETISEFLISPEGKEKTILVFAGSGHVVFDFGIPRRFYRRAPFPFRTVVLKEWKKNVDQDLTNTGTPLSIANFLWVTRPQPPEKERPRMGVVLKQREGQKGFWIERVIPKSPAEKAGLLPGDQMVAVEGIEIARVKDIHDALSQKGWGKDFTVTILREGLKKEIMVTLPPFKE
ncbi:MAG: ChaN family lipoprotein [Thermodesulfobacteriota bacterium]